MAINVPITGNANGLINELNKTKSQVAQTAQSINKSGQSVDGFFTKIGKNFDSMKNNIVDGLKSMTMGMMGFTAAMEAGNFLKEMLGNVGEFNKAMREVSTISDEVTDNMGGFKDQILELTTNIPIGATEAAKALYQIISSGQDGADAMNVLAVSAKAAIAGVTDTATSADTITTILNSYHMSAKEAEHVSDMLFATIKKGKTTMSELGASIAQVAPTAAAYGVKIEELLAAVAALTKQGTPTALAMTQLNAIITQGVEVLGDGAFQGRSFADALAEIAKKSQGSMQDLKADVANVRAMKAVLQMTGDSAGTAADALDALQNSAGAANEAFDKMADAEAIKKLQNNLQKSFQPIGEEMKGISKDIANAINEAFESGAMQNYIAAIEGCVAAYGVYKTAVMMAMAVESLQKGLLGGLTLAEKAYMIQLIITEKAQKLLNATMLVNPYVAAAAAVGVLVGALIYLAKREDSARIAQRKLNEELKEQNKALEEAKNNIDDLVAKAADEADANNKRGEALDALTLKYGSIIGKYIDEEGHLTNIIELKRKLYELESGKKYNEQKAEADKYANYAKIIGKFMKFSENRSKLSESERKILDEAQAAYKKETGEMASYSQMMGYFNTKQKGYQREAGRTKIDAAVAKFSSKFGEMTDDRLKEVINDLESALERTNGGKNGVHMKSGAFGSYLEKSDIDKMLIQARGIQDSRQQKADAQKSKKQQESEAKAAAKAAAAQKKADSAAKKIAEDAEKLADLEERQAKDAQRAAKEQQLAANQARIDAMKEGSRREMEQIKQNYEKEKFEIQKEREDILADRAENARALWEAKNTTAMEKGATWTNSGAKKAFDAKNVLSAQDTTYFEAREKAAFAKYQKEYKDMLKSETDKEMNNLMNKVKSATAIAELGMGFNQVQEKVLEEMRNYMNTDDFKNSSEEVQRDYYEKLNQFNEQAGLTSTSFKDLKAKIEHYANSVANLDAAHQRQKDAMEEAQKNQEILNNAEKALADAEIAYNMAIDGKSKESAAAVLNNARSTYQSAYVNSANSDANLEQATRDYNTAKNAQIESEYAAIQASNNLKGSIQAVGNIADAVASKSMSKLWQALEPLIFKDKDIKRVTALKEGLNGVIDTATKIDFNDISKKLTKGLDEIMSSIGDDMNVDELEAKVKDVISNALDGLGENDTLTKALSSQLGNVFGKLTDALTAGGDAGEAIEKAAGEIGGIISKLGEGGQSSGSVWGIIIGVILQLLDEFGKNGIGEFVEELLTNIGTAIQGILENIGSGKFFEQIASGIYNLIVGIVGGVFNLLTGGMAGDIVGIKGNIEEANEAIDELTMTNKVLSDRLSELNDTIKNSTLSGASKAYEDAKQTLSAEISNESKKIQTEAGKWEAGSHSVLSQLNDDKGFKQMLEQVSAILGKDVLSARWFMDLAPEELKKLRDENTDLYLEMLRKISAAENEHTGSGIADMIEEYINSYADAFDDLQDSFQEKLTQTSFDSVFDNFKSLLTDMNTSAEDWSKNFEDMMRNAVVNSLGDSFKEQLKSWYEDFAAAMEDESLTSSERAQLMSKYQAIVDKAQADRDALYEMLDIQNNGAESATRKSIGQITEDQADAIEGRLTAIQINSEIQRAGVDTIVSSITQMMGILDIEKTANEMRDDIRNLIATGNGHLEDIVKWSKQSYEVLNQRLANIETNTQNI